MAVNTADPPLGADYPAIFRTYIIKSTRHILARVRQAGPILSSGEQNQILHTLSYALKIPEAWPDSRGLLLTAAPKMEQAGRRDGWRPYLEQGIHQSQQLGDLEAEAELHFQVGILGELRSKYEEARTHFEASAAIFERLNAPRNQARALNRLAYIARLQRQFEEAISLVETVGQLLEAEGGQPAYSYFVLGLVALDKRNWPEAVDFSKKSLSLWGRENNQRMMGRSLITIVAALSSLKKHQEAIEACQKAIVLFKEIQDPIYQAVAQLHLGNVYLLLKQPLESLRLYLPAKRTFRRAQYKLRLAMVNNNMGMAYRLLRQWDKAERAYLSSLELQQEMGNIALLVNTMDELGLLYLQHKQHKKAVATFEEALNRLAQIKGEPNYNFLLKMVTSHLQEASKYCSSTKKD